MVHSADDPVRRVVRVDKVAGIVARCDRDELPQIYLRRERDPVETGTIISCATLSLSSRTAPTFSSSSRST